MTTPSAPPTPYMERVRARAAADVEYATRQGFEGAQLIAWAVCLAGHMISDSLDGVGRSIDARE